jgi:predicted component of type VI protein secretion system
MKTARFRSLDDSADILFDFAPMVVVGRHPSCDLRIESNRISQFHCCMSLLPGEVMVRDLGSTNGTRINGRCVHAGRLRDGDELAIAHLRYRLAFHEDDRDDGQMTVIRNTTSHQQLCVDSLRSGSWKGAKAVEIRSR